MKKSLQSGLISFAVLFLLISCNSENTISPPPEINSVPATQLTSGMAVEWVKLSYEIVKFQDIPAPTCSRYYGYIGVTIYEAVHKGIPNHKSLAGQLNEMPQMPQPSNEEYDWLSVMIGALNVVSRELLIDPHSYSLGLIDELYDRQIQERKDSVGNDITERSLSYGKQIGEAIVLWAGSDNFDAAHSLPYTAPPRTENPANWEPTAPGADFIEPYLGQNRTFSMPSSDYCFVPLGIQFDTVPGSFFYLDGMEVLEKSQTLTQDERNISLFWEDKTGTGQPPGHWMSITNNMVTRFNLNLAEAAKLYALMGASTRDAFISAWESKLRINLLRPKTYIRHYLGQPNWNEFINTPPWPDYTSGHSVGSGAASTILTYVLGDNIQFVDSTHENQPGRRNRTFNSFYHAAEESAWSRLYGGIHFRRAIEHGVQQGRLVAQVVLGNIKFE
jgi:hypothetical protein